MLLRPGSTTTSVAAGQCSGYCCSNFQWPSVVMAAEAAPTQPTLLLPLSLPLVLSLLLLRLPQQAVTLPGATTVGTAHAPAACAE